MELDCVLLGLIKMHKGLTGYELKQIMQESTGYLISASLSHIYPSLRKLHESGLVSFQDLPIKNSLAKKIYFITPIGEQVLHEWLCKPIEENELNFKPFYLKMAFSPLMSKGTILEHIDREIKHLELIHRERERDIKVEVDFINHEEYDLEKAELLWNGLSRMMCTAYASQLSWLIEWRQTIEQKIFK